MRQGNGHKFRSQIRKDLLRLFKNSGHARSNTINVQIFFRQTDLHAIQTGQFFKLHQICGKVFLFLRQAGAVHRIFPGNHIQHGGGIVNRLGNRTDLVQRRSKRHQTGTGYTPVSRLQPHNTAEGRRLTDGSARIRTECDHAFVRRNNRSRTAGTAAGNPFRIPRIFRFQVCTVFAGGAHGEFVHIGSAQQHKTGFTQPGRHRGIIRRDKAVQNLGGAGTLLTFRADIVLERHGNPVVFAEGRTRRTAGIGFSSCGERQFGIHCKQCADLRFNCIDTVNKSLRQFHRSDLAAVQKFSGFTEGNFRIEHHAMPSPGRTCGTFTSSPLTVSGALASIASRPNGVPAISFASTFTRSTA